MKIKVIQSGSKGNCTIILSDTIKLIIDLGISYKKLIEDGLALYEMGHEAKNKNLFYDSNSGFWFIDFIANNKDDKFDPTDKEKVFIPTYHHRTMNANYRLDFVCLDKIIVECKAVEKLTINHRAQLYNYMRLTKLPIGILVNFSQKSVVIERYLYNSQTNEILSIDGSVLTRFATNNCFVN